MGDRQRKEHISAVWVYDCYSHHVQRRTHRQSTDRLGDVSMTRHENPDRWRKQQYPDVENYSWDEPTTDEHTTLLRKKWTTTLRNNWREGTKPKLPNNQPRQWNRSQQ